MTAASRLPVPRRRSRLEPPPRTGADFSFGSGERMSSGLGETPLAATTRGCDGESRCWPRGCEERLQTEAERLGGGLQVGITHAAVVTFLASPLSVAITGDAIAAGGGVRGPIHY